MKVKRTVTGIALAAFLVVSVLAQKAPSVKVSAKQAVKIATAKYHGSVVGKTALENEKGKWQYAVNIRSGKKLREVMVDAMTGKIASVEVTTPKEEAAEARAEKKKRSGRG